MGLYLCVVDGDEELEGVEVGRYTDFARFRNSITELVEYGVAGSKFPTLVNHSDSDGEWSPHQCQKLLSELEQIAVAFRQLPPLILVGEWQQGVASELGIDPTSLYESFFDIDGEPLLERLIQLCVVAIREQRPILFQ